MPNSVNEWLTTAKAISPERAAKWREVFGTDEVPITCPIPLSVGNFPKVGEKAYYLMDLKAITPEQKERLIASIAAEFEYSIEEVKRDIDRIGVPILADDVVASSSDFGLFMSLVGDDLEDLSGRWNVDSEEESEADYYWDDNDED